MNERIPCFCREGEQEHLREGTRMTQEGMTQGLEPGIELAEHQGGDAKRTDREEREVADLGSRSLLRGPPPANPEDWREPLRGPQEVRRGGGRILAPLLNSGREVAPAPTRADEHTAGYFGGLY
jgi:hypothetical protein